MARRRRNSASSEEKTYNRGGYSQAALDALETGRYRELTGNRQSQYRTSQEQLQQTKELPKLEGMTRSPEWTSAPTSNQTSRIDTDRARAKYAEKYYNRPSTRYSDQSIGKASPNINPNREKQFDKDFDEFYKWRYENPDIRDYDAATDMDVEHWRNVKKDLLKKNKLTEAEFDKRFDEYYNERRQKESDKEVADWVSFAEKHPTLASVGQSILNPGTWMEGGSTVVEGVLSHVLPEKLKEEYIPSDANDYRFEHTRVRDAVKQTVKDKKVKSTPGKWAYEAATGLLDLPGGALGMAANTAAQTQRRKLDNGASRDKAAQTGMLAGATSYVTNKLGLEKALGAEGDTVLKSLGKGALAEGGENLIEDVFNTLSDVVVNRDKSEIGQLYNYYLTQGMSPAQAGWNTAKDLGGQEAASVLSGLLMGGVTNAFGNLPALSGMVANKLTKKTAGAVEDSMKESLGDAMSGRPDVNTNNIDNSTQMGYNNYSTEGGANNGRTETINRTGNQGNIRPEESLPVRAEVGGSVDGGRTYTAEDGRTFSLRDVVDEELSKRMDDAGINNFGLRNTSGETAEFSKQLADAKANNTNGRMVSDKTPEELADAILFSDDARTAGVAIEPNGNIVAVHKNPSNTKRGAVDDMLITARANGGDRLDCYGKGLVRKYEQDGFVPVARVEWNEKFKPSDWGDNPPEEIYVMMKDGRTNEQVLDDIKNRTTRFSTPEELDSLPYFTIKEHGDNAYQRALDYRDALMSNSEDAPVPNRVMAESIGANNPKLTSEVTRNMPHVNGTMPNDGRMKTSKYYDSTMRNTPTNAEMDDAEYGARFNRDEYGYITSSHKETDAKSNQFIQESGGEDAAIDRILNEELDGDENFDAVHIDAAEKLAEKVERQAKELEAQGQDATAQWMLANRLHKKIQENGTIHAKGLEILKKWKQSTPQGQVDYIVTEVNKSVDGHKTKGYTKMVNNMANDVEDAILNSPDKKSATENVKKAFAKNRGNSDYNTEKYEQLVLDLIGGEDFGMRSPASIAEEAGALIKSKMGVSSLTARQERAMIDLFEQASRYKENSRSYNECISRAMSILDSALPSSVGDKIRSVMYDNMLASLKTMLTRNLGGNVLANAIETTSKPLQVLADIAASKVTKNRTRTLTGQSIIEGARGFKKGVQDWYLDVKNGVDTTRSGQNSLEDSLRAVHKTFKTQSNNKAVKGLNTALGGYDRVVRKGMELGDRPVYEMRYAATKAELLDIVDRFGDEGLRKGLPEGRNISTDELIELIAVNEGLEAVLQNDSTMKEGAKALKKAIGKTSEDILGIDVATMSTTPFVEVPANMASRFFQFTPFGIVGNVIRSIREKSKTGAVNQRRMTGEAGRNALGSLMAAGAMGLAGNGFISDPYSEDPDEKKLQQNNDYLEYALQTPDGERQIDLSDIPVLGPMLRYGKMQYDALQEGGIPELIGNIPNAAGSATIDTLYQGLNKLTGASNSYNSGESILSNAKNAVVSSIGSMINPALIRQTAQFLDPYKRDLGDYGTSEYNKNLIVNGLPILREMMLNPKVGTSGEPVKQNGGDISVGKFLNTYLAPWKISSPKENMSDAQKYAEMLKEQTDGAVNPQPPVFNAKDLKGIKGYDKENYTHEDLYKIDNVLYKLNNDMANKLIDDQWYRSLSPEKQGRYLDMLYSSGKEIVKENFVKEGMTPEEIEKAGKDIYTADSKLSKILREDDENLSGMKEYFHNVDGIENLEDKYGYKMDYDTYVKWNTEPDKKALGGAEKYAEVHDKAKELNMTVENYLKAEQEYAGGAEQKAADKEAAKQLGFVKKDGATNFQGYEQAVATVGNDPKKIAFYQDYKSQKFEKGTNQKVPYVMNSPLSNEERAKLITNTTDPSKLEGAGIRGAYDVGGWDGVWYWRQSQYYADTQFGDGNGSVKKAEKEALLDALYDPNNPYIPDMPDDIYNYLVEVPNKQW